MSAPQPPVRRRLATFTGSGYDKGRPFVIQLSWLLVSGLIFTRWWCPASLRARLLRLFGAQVGSGTVIRQGVRIHWPWKLTVGDHTWIGEGAYLLNLEPISLGNDVCLSQQALLCTGSHDHREASFDFDNAPIDVEDGVWVAARATVLRGVRIGTGAVVGATALVTQDVPPGSIVLAPQAQVRLGADTGAP